MVRLGFWGGNFPCEEGTGCPQNFVVSPCLEASKASLEWAWSNLWIVESVPARGLG